MHDSKTKLVIKRNHKCAKTNTCLVVWVVNFSNFFFGILDITLFLKNYTEKNKYKIL